ncbi:MAG: flagellar basal body rod protein FlgB [Candidatus Sericytochromatia bacterium]
MLTERIFGRKDMMVEKALDGLALRMNTSASNLANVNTPGYVRQDVTFEDALAQAYEQSPKNLPAFDPTYTSPLQNFQAQVQRQPAVQRIDGNGITPEVEMNRMVESAIAYNALVRQTGFSTLKTVIQNSK